MGSLFNTVATPLPLREEQADFFGFKRIVDPLDCLKLFEHMQKAGSVDVQNYTELLKHLLRGIDRLSEGQKMELRKKLPLLALCEAKSANLDPQTVLGCLAEKARSLKIFYALRIPLAPGSSETCDIALMGNGLYYKRGCSERKRKIGEQLALYFQLGAKMKTLLPEILSLKEATDLGGKMGIPDFLRKWGIHTEEWHALLRIYSAKDLTLEGVAPQSTLSAAGAAALPPPDPRVPEKDPTPQYRMEEIVVGKLENPTHLLPPPDPGPLYKPSAKQRPAPKERTAQEKEVDRANGHLGEEFLFKYLIYRFEHHEGASFKKSFTCQRKEAIENGVKFHITYQGDTHYTIEVRWLNAQCESGLQRDIDILWHHHQKEIKRRHIDVKASLVLCKINFPALG